MCGRSCENPCRPPDCESIRVPPLTGWSAVLGLLFSRHLFADAVFLVEPAAEVHELATPTAERAKRDLGGGVINHLAPADWALE
jgi:hypothetical protein